MRNKENNSLFAEIDLSFNFILGDNQQKYYNENLNCYYQKEEEILKYFEKL